MTADGNWSSMSGLNKILDLLEKHFIIGIDLGTTNAAVSYVDLLADAKKKYKIKIFKVPQLTGFFLSIIVLQSQDLDEEIRRPGTSAPLSLACSPTT